jgi:hypothetical protein
VQIVREFVGTVVELRIGQAAGPANDCHRVGSLDGLMGKDPVYRCSIRWLDGQAHQSMSPRSEVSDFNTSIVK